MTDPQLVRSLLARRVPVLRFLLASIGASALLLLSVSAVEAQSEVDVRDRTISGARPELHASVGGHGDFGLGFRVDVPVVPNGFLHNGRDEFALSPGVDFQFFDFNHGDGETNGVLFMPQLAAQWNIYFPRGWSIFPELGLAVVIGDERHGYDDRGHGAHVDGLVAFGARRHFTSRTSLVMRAGFPNGFQIGVTI